MFSLTLLYTTEMHVTLSTLTLEIHNTGSEEVIHNRWKYDFGNLQDPTFVYYIEKLEQRNLLGV